MLSGLVFGDVWLLVGRCLSSFEVVGCVLCFVRGSLFVVCLLFDVVYD